MKHRHVVRRSAAVIAIALGATLVASPAQAGDWTQCTDLDPTYKTLKYDGEPYVGQVISNGDLSITVTAVQKKDRGAEVVGFAWTSSDPGPQAVIIKGGTGTKVYPSVNGRTDSEFIMFAPTKGPAGSGSKHHGISNIQFCY
jgi:hypothetical protein